MTTKAAAHAKTESPKNPKDLTEHDLVKIRRQIAELQAAVTELAKAEGRPLDVTLTPPEDV